MDSNDYSVEAVCRSDSAALGIGPAARMAASSAVTYYAFLIFGGDNAYLVYINAGGETVLAAASGVTINANTNYTLRIEVEGNAIRGYVNGTQRASATHSALSSGPPGIGAYGGGNTGTWADDWTASDLGGGAQEIAVTDSGAGADALAGLGVSLGLSDSGTGTEAFGGAAALAAADSGTAADALAQLLAALAVADSGSGSDAPGDIAAGVPAVETGSGSDALTQLLAELSVQDSGGGSDGASVAVTLSVADSGGGIDATLKLVLAAVADSGVGVDAVQQIAVTLAVGETGVGSDAPSVVASILVADVGTVEDAVSVLSEAMKEIAESGAGVDAVSSPLVSVTVAESGSGADGATVSVLLAVADVGSGLDALSVLSEAIKQVAENAAGSDAVLIPAIAVSVA